MSMASNWAGTESGRPTGTTRGANERATRMLRNRIAKVAAPKMPPAPPTAR